MVTVRDMPPARPWHTGQGMAYPVALLLHLFFVMTLFGTSIATDRALSAARRGADGLLAHARGKLVPLESVCAVGALILGFVLITVHPAGVSGLMKSGMWIHVKLTAGLLGVAGVGLSRFGIGEAAIARWVQPVRGVGQLAMVLALVSVTLLRAM